MTETSTEAFARISAEIDAWTRARVANHKREMEAAYARGWHRGCMRSMADSECDAWFRQRGFNYAMEMLCIEAVYGEELFK